MIDFPFGVIALSGVGHMTVIDHDTVDLSNLARQSLHSRASIGTNKALSAQASLTALAPNITVTPIPTALDPTNALSLLADHDLILDCTDNPATRYLLNDAAVALHTPLVSAAAQQYDGQLAVYIPPEAACHTTFDGTLGSIPTYDAAKCAAVTANYSGEQWVTDQAAILLWKYFTNSSCTPTTNPSEPCSLGYYGVYILTVTSQGADDTD